MTSKRKWKKSKVIEETFEMDAECGSKKKKEKKKSYIYLIKEGKKKCIVSNEINVM